PAPLFVGSVVTATNRDGLYVIIGLPNGKSSSYRAVPLGGDAQGSYLRGGRDQYTLVPADTLVTT
ncbi:hypothetical protein ACIGO9_31860, partial [Nocardia asteroides]|uniref:hypothetical protein n=1 Tax=Nocardia asteroides TaxID=1824 RepID=UPI0037CB1B66